MDSSNKGLMTISISKYFKILVKFWWIVAISVILGLVVISINTFLCSAAETSIQEIKYYQAESIIRVDWDENQELKAGYFSLEVLV